jgi:cytochrome c2
MIRAFLLLFASASLALLPASDAASILEQQRSSAGDLEVGGELAGVPAGAVRYIRYDDLLRLPQEKYTVTDDSNFKGKTEIEGVALDTLGRVLGRDSVDAMIVAICYDRYRTNYPRDYMAAHHPVLVLRINGQLRDRWPRSESGDSLGPYLISHPEFKPAFKVLSHQDEPQIPYGVTRIEIRRESRVFGAIRPQGTWQANSPVMKGYAIARQDCFRCHNMGNEGGTLAGRSWMQLARLANQDSRRFEQTIRDPASLTPGAKMPAQSNYDQATLDALTAYFKTFEASKGAR